jgi:serine protease AprX
MAGPHVAGLVALLIDAQPDLAGDVDTIEALIQETAVRLYTEEGCGGDSPQSIPNNTYGWGRIDAYSAYIAATAQPTPLPKNELFIPTWFSP